MVLTFDPHPTRVVRPDKAPRLLMTEAQKSRRSLRPACAVVAIVRFTPELSHWEPETFVRRVLVDWLGVSEVWVGATSCSGTAGPAPSPCCGRSENATASAPTRSIPSACAARRCRARASGGCSPKGRVDEAGALLGRHFYIDGDVVPGDGRGRLIGFPTANLRTANELLPPHGVYATIAQRRTACCRR